MINYFIEFKLSILQNSEQSQRINYSFVYTFAHAFIKNKLFIKFSEG